MNLIELRAREIAEKERADKAQEEQRAKEAAIQGVGNIASAATGLLNPVLGAGVKAAFAARNMGRFTNKQNDSSWYKRYPWLVLNSAKIPFFYHKGKFLVQSDGLVVNTPGILKIRYLPACSHEAIDTSAGAISNSSMATSFNKVANDFMAAVYQYIKVDRNYASQDVVRYLVTLDGILSWIAKCTRILQACKKVSEDNYYLDKAMVGVLFNQNGLTSSSLQTIIMNIPEAEKALNDLITTLNTLYIPDLPLFRRHIWLEGSVFKDDAGSRAELYIFERECIHLPSFTGGIQLDSWNGASFGVCVTGQNGDEIAREIPMTGTPISAIINNSLSLARALDRAKPMMSYVSADLAAIEKVNDPALRIFYRQLQLGGFSYNDLKPLEPYYDEEVLDQIHNTTFTGARTAVTITAGTGESEEHSVYFFNNVRGDYQYGGYLYSANAQTLFGYKYLFNGTTSGMTTYRENNVVLDTEFEEDPSQDKILTMSRNKMVVSYTGSTTGQGAHGACFKVDANGSEIFTEAILYQTSEASSSYQGDASWQTGTTTLSNYNNTVSAFAHVALSRFDHCPYYITGNVNANSFDMLGNLTNPGVISATSLNDLHIGCYRSLVGLINTNAGGTPNAYKGYDPSVSKDQAKRGKSRKPSKEPGIGTGDGN